MRFQVLETFVHASHSLNFTKTAQELHLTQSAVSQQMAEFQNVLEIPVFERRGRRLQLTKFGREMQTRAEQIEALYRAMLQSAQTHKCDTHGSVKIAASPTAASYLLPHAMGTFERSYPGILTSLSLCNVEVATKLARRHEIDIIVSEQDVGLHRLPEWDRTKFLKDELVLVVAPSHTWATRYSIEPWELQDQVLILRTRSSKTRQMVISKLESVGLQRQSLNVRFEIDNSEAIIQAVMAGLGVGFVSRFAAQAHQRAKSVVVVPVEGLHISRTFWLHYPQPDKLSNAVHLFVSHLSSATWMPVK